MIKKEFRHYYKHNEILNIFVKDLLINRSGKPFSTTNGIFKETIDKILCDYLDIYKYEYFITRDPTIIKTNLELLISLIINNKYINTNIEIDGFDSFGKMGIKIHFQPNYGNSSQYTFISRIIKLNYILFEKTCDIIELFNKLMEKNNCDNRSRKNIL